MNRAEDGLPNNCGSITGGVNKSFLFSKASTPASETTELAALFLPRALFLWVKRRECVGDDSRPSSTDIKNACNCTFIHLTCLHDVHRDLILTLTLQLLSISLLRYKAKKLKQFLYKSGQPPKISGRRGSQISRSSAH